MKSGLILLGTLLPLLVFSSAYGVVVDKEFDELVHEADLIVIGNVTSIEPTYSIENSDSTRDKFLHDVDLKVEKTFFKDIASPEISFRILQNRQDENFNVDISISQDFEKGERVLLFLKHDPKNKAWDGKYHVLGSFQGKYILEDGKAYGAEFEGIAEKQLVSKIYQIKDKPRYELGHDFEIKYNETVSVGGLHITFSDVKTDSRCPTDVVCVWQGMVSAELQVKTGNDKQTMVLDSDNNQGKDFGGYKITLIDAKPKPVSRKTIQLVDYSISLNVAKSQETISSPLEQFQNGVEFDQIRCKQDLMLVQKYDGSPACVKPSTVFALVNRGWADRDSTDLKKIEIEIARNFVQTQSKTYAYDGIPESLEVGLATCEQLGDCVVRAEFDSRHAGYGNRTGQVLAQVITHHTVNMAIGQDGQISWAKMDGKWDVIKQQMVTPVTEPGAKTASADSVVDAHNQFALDFYSNVAQNTSSVDNNIFFSPWSISTAFSIAYEGAREDTAQQIRETFRFTEYDMQRRTSFQTVQDQLNQNSSEYNLNVANSLWIKQGYKIRQDFVNVAKQYYSSKVENVDFVSDEGVHAINDWTSSKTDGKIEKLLKEGSTDQYTRLVIANAIYFNGTWEHPFNPKFTEKKDFHVNSTTSVKVPMMSLDKANLGYAKTDKLQILELPYKGGDISMFVLLPSETQGVSTLADSLSVDRLSEWKNMMQERQVSVYLPKFTLETDYDLKKQLKSMGMKIPFDKNEANFSGINATEQLYINQAIHKAYVDVNEIGTEAAAATGIEIRAESAPANTFRADHPFVFIIQDNRNDNILFIGRVMDPTK